MTDNDDQAMRDFTRALFSHADEPDEPVAKPSGHVASEAGTPQKTGADPMRDFVGRLFGTDENASGLSRD